MLSLSPWIAPWVVALYLTAINTRLTTVKTVYTLRHGYTPLACC